MRLFGKKQTAPEPTVGAGSGSIEMVPMLELTADEIEEFDRRAESQRSRAMPSPDACLMLAALLAGDPDERVRRAASWAFGKIPPTGAEPGTAPIGLLTRWFMLRSAKLVRAGKKELAEPDRTQFLAQADQIEADRRAREPVMASAPAGDPDLPPPPPM